MTNPLLVVDTPSLYFRAFYGVPDQVTAPDGTPVNAVRGCLDMVATLVRTRRPGRLICCLDLDWRPQWRVALLPSYKAHRVADDSGAEQVPDTLTPQVPILLDVLAAFGIPAIGAVGYEADDVAGTLAATQPGPVEVVTGDRDLFQLIDDTKPVRVLYCGRGVAKLEVYDDAALQRRYGVPAARYVDFAVLRGDPSDGLPGVAGIGEKTAAALLAQHGDLDAVMAAVDAPTAAGVKPAARARLAAARDYLTVAPRVVRVARDVPLPDVDGTVTTAAADVDRLTELADRWNLAGPIGRLTDALTEASTGR